MGEVVVWEGLGGPWSWSRVMAWSRWVVGGRWVASDIAHVAWRVRGRVASTYERREGRAGVSTA